MKSALIFAGFLAAMAAASPVEERGVAIDWKFETITVTVTGSHTRGPWGQWGGATHTAVSVPVSSSKSTEAKPTPTPTSTSISVPISTPISTPISISTTTSVAIVASSSSKPAQTATSTQGLSDYAAPIVNQHNLHRANHSAPALVWDDKLASIAAQIAGKCVYAHDTTTGGGGYGQNIGAGAPGSDIPGMITNQMYNGEVNYYPGYGGEPSMDEFEKWGHFSQIVWASTTSVGCYTQYCTNGLANVGDGVSPYFTVCNYSPPGNFGGQYGKNVLSPAGDATVTVA